VFYTNFSFGSHQTFTFIDFSSSWKKILNTHLERASNSDSNWLHFIFSGYL
jgi:hypothetical protein